MNMRRIVFVTDRYYHIYNRGVEKRTIFQEYSDYQRMLIILDEFNSPDPIHIAAMPSNEAKPRKKIVEIICFCLMPNHYHLVLKQIANNGISQFMHKLGTGYTMFFNKKWERSGALFEGPFKAKHIENNEYLLHLSRYIHLNPLNIIEPRWKEEGIKDVTRAKSFLREYAWSSYPVYLKRSANSKIISAVHTTMVLDDVINYENFVLSWTSKDSKTLRG